MEDGIYKLSRKDPADTAIAPLLPFLRFRFPARIPSPVGSTFHGLLQNRCARSLLESESPKMSDSLNWACHFVNGNEKKGIEARDIDPVGSAALRGRACPGAGTGPGSQQTIFSNRSNRDRNE
jgi:hypothetical protein